MKERVIYGMLQDYRVWRLLKIRRLQIRSFRILV